jgi:hypothetical protein
VDPPEHDAQAAKPSRKGPASALINNGRNVAAQAISPHFAIFMPFLSGACLISAVFLPCLIGRIFSLP